ncbi:hypothetical protein CRUP_030480 [Coryphaenoides rupestris]|nr:hypothetical protein CRUP_030480 [Coryphaenoides rupestris]
MKDVYSAIVTPRRAWVAVCLCWVLSFLSGLVPMLGWHHDPRLHGYGNGSGIGIDAGDASIVCKFTSVVRMDYMVYFNFFGCVVAPLAVMTALYGEIFRLICRQLERRAEATVTAAAAAAAATGNGSGFQRYYHKELRLAKSLALIVALFALCWLPLHVMNCVALFCPAACPLPKAAVYTGIFMSHVNSALNPLVYAFRIKRFRVTLVRVARRCALCPPATASTVTAAAAAAAAEPASAGPSGKPILMDKMTTDL